jgi:hypothetical protein
MRKARLFRRARELTEWLANIAALVHFVVWLAGVAANYHDPELQALL